MDLLEAGDLSGAGQRMVLRRYGAWHSDGRSRDVVVREGAALRAVAAAGIAAPEVAWVDEEGVFEERAILLSYVEGEVVMQPDDPGLWAEALAVMAARIHRVPVDDEVRDAVLDIGGQLEEWKAQESPPERFVQHRNGVRLWERRQKLLESLPPFEPALVHNDFWPGNVLWRNGRIAAVIDWEDAGFGDPMADVGYCANDMRYAGFDDAADRFVARYAKESGRSLGALLFWTAVALTRPLPDIARWLPGWQAMGQPGMTAERLRAIYDDLIERVLD